MPKRKDIKTNSKKAAPRGSRWFIALKELTFQDDDGYLIELMKLIELMELIN